MKRQKTKDIIAMSIFIGGILAIWGIMLFSGYQDNKDRKEALDMAEKNSHWAKKANKQTERDYIEGAIKARDDIEANSKDYSTESIYYHKHKSVHKELTDSEIARMYMDYGPDQSKWSKK